jgi:hypothetical protein
MKPGEKNVLPPKAGHHFPRFIIKHRNTEDNEEVKKVLKAFEKDVLLLTLIPIAFDIDLETQVQFDSLFVTRKTLSALSGTLFLFPLDITEFRRVYTKQHTMSFCNWIIITWIMLHC